MSRRQLGAAPSTQVASPATFLEAGNTAWPFHDSGRLDIPLSLGHFPTVFVPRRLDKYLRDSTALSVPEIRDACLAHRVSVTMSNGTRTQTPEPEFLVFEDDSVTLDGKPVLPRRCHQYLILNKPRFVTTTAKDPEGKACLAPILAQLPGGVFAVGRLDRESSGALLFTDDGDFANAILQPDRHTSKRYWLWLDEELADDDPRLQAFRDGVVTAPHQEPLRVTHLEVQHRTGDYAELLVTLHEGKNRHLRKMCNVLGLRLLQLHRQAIGGLTLEGLAIGQWRHLTTTEVDTLWANSGGRKHATELKLAALTRLAQRARQSSASLERLERWLENVGAAGARPLE
jgi:23S rRNA pseudouridine2605 synthase